MPSMERKAGLARSRETSGTKDMLGGGTEMAHPPAGDDLCCAMAPARGGAWRPWLIGAALVVPVALYVGWDWLVATGLATLVVALAPCVLMCALGLCMQRGKPAAPAPLAEIRRSDERDAREPPGRA